MHTTSRLFTCVAILTGAAITAYFPASAADSAPHDHNHAATPQTDNQSAQDKGSSGMLQKMQRMHEKLMAAKTPAERDALMAEHHMVMQEGMTMMQAAHETMSKDCMSSDATKTHMNMMSMMMQMMMNQAPAATSATH